MSLERRGFVLIAALFALGLTGCPKEQTPNTAASDTATSTNTSTTKQLKIAFIPKGQNHQFWQAMKKGMEDAAKEENAETQWLPPTPEGDITKQVNIVTTTTNNKVDGIILAATDATALVAPVKEAMAKGISVVTVDSGIKEDIANCYIATDNVKGGEAAADFLAKQIGEKGNVGLIIFGKGSVSSDEREKGFVDGIKKYPNIKLVSTLEANDATKALNVATNMITANPNLAGIFAANEPNGVGVSQVLQDKKLVGKIKLVAYDSSDKEIEALNNGSIQGLIVQDPYQMGYKGVKTVIKAIKKEDIGEKVLDSGFVLVTKENLNTPEVQKLVK